MTQKRFAQICKDIIDKYLEQAHLQLSAGNYSTDVENEVFLFPTHILVGLVEGYLAFELVGSSPTFQPLKLKYTKPKSLNGFLGQLNDSGEAGFVIGGKNNGFTDLRLETGLSGAELLRRFPQIAEQYPTTLKFNIPNCNKAFKFVEGFDFFTLENVLMSNIFGENVRVRNPLLLMLISNRVTSTKLKDYLKERYTVQNNQNLQIVRTVPSGQSVRTQLRSQFYNLYLQEGILETAIGDFLNAHREILLKAFDGQDLIYEPSLDWQVDIGQEEASINPDFMVKRSDGYYDVYDLKLPLLSNTALTRGSFARRRFAAPVDEGRAQLANYFEYFKHKANVDHCYEKYGIKIQNPAMVLIVGNYENYDVDLIAQASRGIANFGIVDYDTLLNLYNLKASG